MELLSSLVGILLCVRLLACIREFVRDLCSIRASILVFKSTCLLLCVQECVARVCVNVFACLLVFVCVRACVCVCVCVLAGVLIFMYVVVCIWIRFSMFLCVRI